MIVLVPQPKTLMEIIMGARVCVWTPMNGVRVLRLKRDQLTNGTSLVTVVTIRPTLHAELRRLSTMVILVLVSIPWIRAMSGAKAKEVSGTVLIKSVFLRR